MTLHIPDELYGIPAVKKLLKQQAKEQLKNATKDNTDNS